MYEYRDVNEALEGYILPSEALKINGEYIENLVSGYRTLTVKGREALSPDVVTFTTGVRDGSRVKSKRFPERIITVKYQLRADSNEAFRAAYNQLAQVLNVEDAELIFNDEQDKFFVGTPCIIGAVNPGINSVIGEFEILCADPFKYSVMEYEAEPSLEDSSIMIDYKGTYKAYPTLEADFFSEDDVSEDGESHTELTGAGDCGYVAFFNEKEKIIQLGSPEETDEVQKYAASQTLANQKFDKTNSWGTAASNLWDSTVYGNALPTPVVEGGSMAMAVATQDITTNQRIQTGTALNVTTATSPPFVYQITYRSERTSNTTCKITFNISVSLKNANNYFGRGYILQGALWCGSGWKQFRIKNTNDYWRGTTVHRYTVVDNVTISANTTGRSGYTFTVSRYDSNTGTAGTLAETALSEIKIGAYTAYANATYYLAPASYGSASNKWHGVVMGKPIPADALGEDGAANFTLTYKQKMNIGTGTNATKQLGAFQVHIADTEGQHLVGLRIWKCQAGNKAKLQTYMKNQLMTEDSIDLSYNNRYFGSKESSVQTSTITKTGQNIKITTGGITRSFSNNTIGNTKAYRVTFIFEQWSNSTPLASNGLYWVKFVKHNCEQYVDVPNKFGADDVVIADCKNATILLNGLEAPELGALGNDWEDFVLEPGFNQIGIAYSNWLTDETAPKIKVRYREVFL